MARRRYSRGSGGSTDPRGRRRVVARMLVGLLVGGGVAATVGILQWPLPTDGRAAVSPAPQPSTDGTTRDDGVVPDGASLSPGDDAPAVTRLDPALREAAEKAFAAARAAGVDLSINSGWRSRALQQRLLDDAVEQYGSEQEALRWVSTPDASEHTSGRAIDVGPTGEVGWLDENGYRFGLCRTYDNEAWHFELATTPGSPCPPRVADAASR